MKEYVKISLLYIYVLAIVSCSHKKNEHQPPLDISTSKAVNKKITIRFAGEVDFRRSYSHIQFMDNEKEIARYVEKQKKSDPLVMYGQNEILRNRFEELGIVKGEELLLNKFKYNTKNEFRYDSESGKKLNVRIKNNLENISETDIMVVADQDSSEIKVNDFVLDLKHALLDIIPGGNKEIIVLNNYYIMNGDNFDLMVYEIIER